MAVLSRARRAGPSRHRVGAALAVGLVAVAACGGSGYTRDEVRDRWVQTFAVRYGMLEETAACVVDGFFADLDDDELRPLTKGSELTDAQAARVTELLGTCGYTGEAAA